MLDGGGPMAERTEAIAASIEVTGAKVARFAQRGLVRRCRFFPSPSSFSGSAVELVEARGVSPGPLPLRDPRREAACEALGF